MNARERLCQVQLRCVTDARDEREPKFVRDLAAANAAMIAEVVLNGSDADCQTRVELLLQAAPELFPS